MKLPQEKNVRLQTFATAEAAAGEPAVLDSAQVFRGRSEVVIRHDGRDYRLRRTRLGKLILTA